MILEGIEDIAGVKTWADLKKWMQDSGTKLEAFTGTDGFDTINGRNFMSGESGRIWKLKGMDLVLKLTTDLEEIELAKKVEIQQLPSFLKIHKSINLKGIGRDGEKVPAQIRIQELCDPINWSGLTGIGEYELLGWIQEYIDQIYPGYIKETGKTDIDLEFVDFFLETIQQDPEYDPDTEYNSSDKQMILTALQFGVQLWKDVKKLTEDPHLHNIDLNDNNVMQSKDGSWKMIDF
jgi:hypothetical protein